MIPDCAFRKLRPNHIKSTPSRMIYLDVETTKREEQGHEQNFLKLAWACYVETRKSRKKNTEVWECFKEAEELCAFIEYHTFGKSALYVFAHNIFFDLQSSDFFYYFSRKDWTLKFYHDKGLSYALIINKQCRSIKCISTTNFFDFSLDKIGQMLGMPKGRVEFDNVSEAELSAYCRQDVEIIKAAMEQYFKFLKEHDLAHFSVTKASQAFNCFRHRFMDQPVYFHDHSASTELEKQSYIGGRTEAFHMGWIHHSPFVTLDVNSMYPYVMKNYPLPYKLIDYSINPSMKRLRDALSKYAVVAECEIKTDEPIYAVRYNKKICFPIGKIVVYLCTGAIDRALVEGHLLKTRIMAVYAKDILFDRYVEYFYELRDCFKVEGNEPYERMVKIFLNSLYGKFAQYVPIQDEHVDTSQDGYYREEILNAETGQTEIIYKMFNKIVHESGREVGKNSLIAISSHITEYARLILWDIIKPLYPDKVLYCDTDSVMIRAKHLPWVKWPMDEKQLGALKVQKEFNRLEIRGAKSYITEQERVIKGVPKSAQEVEPYRFRFTSFQRQATHMRQRIDRWFETKTIERVCKPYYDKGGVLPDGTVKPFSLTMF